MELEYTQALAAENGLVQYVYPLSTEKFSAKPLESVTVNVEIESNLPIRAVYSPSHDVAVTRRGDTRVKVGYEASNVLPDTDFALYYSLGESEAFHVLTYRDPTDPCGCGWLFPGDAGATPGGRSHWSYPKDVILVLDQSGSMEGDKFIQAQEALRYILDHLNSQDRFNIISFSTGTQAYANNLRPASEAARGAPLGRYAERTRLNRHQPGFAGGGLADEPSSAAEAGRPTYVIFLTDGLPTEGEVIARKSRIISVPQQQKTCAYFLLEWDLTWTHSCSTHWHRRTMGRAATSFRMTA